MLNRLGLGIHDLLVLLGSTKSFNKHFIGNFFYKKTGLKKVKYINL